MTWWSVGSRRRRFESRVIGHINSARNEWLFNGVETSLSRSTPTLSRRSSTKTAEDRAINLMDLAQGRITTHRSHARRLAAPAVTNHLTLDELRLPDLRYASSPVVQKCQPLAVDALPPRCVTVARADAAQSAPPSAVDGLTAAPTPDGCGRPTSLTQTRRKSRVLSWSTPYSRGIPGDVGLSQIDVRRFSASEKLEDAVNAADHGIHRSETRRPRR